MVLESNEIASVDSHLKFIWMEIMHWISSDSLVCNTSIVCMYKLILYRTQSHSPWIKLLQWALMICVLHDRQICIKALQPFSHSTGAWDILALQPSWFYGFLIEWFLLLPILTSFLLIPFVSTIGIVDDNSIDAIHVFWIILSS